MISDDLEGAMSITVSKNMKRFNHLIGEIGAAYHAASLKLGVSDSVMQILYTIYDVGESCLLTDICRLTGLTKQTVNSAIRNLEKEGTVCLIPVNSKSKKVALTAKGILLASQTVAKLVKAENAILDAWSEEDVARYLMLTKRYLDALNEKVEGL